MNVPDSFLRTLMLELTTPLTAALGYLDLLEESLSRTTPRHGSTSRRRTKG